MTWWDWLAAIVLILAVSGIVTFFEKRNGGGLFVLFLFLLGCGQVDGYVKPQAPTIEIVNHGSTSARVYYDDGLYLGRVSADSKRCFVLHQECSWLVIERADGTWLTPPFSPFMADGWRMELEASAHLVYGGMSRTLLPARRCR